MLARIQKSIEEKEEGFTLIELLVVMIIIGILAAIAIPVFLNQRKKAQDSAAKADVSTIGKEIATYFVDNCAVPHVNRTAAGRWELTADAPVAPCSSPAGGIAAGAPEGDLGKASDNVARVADISFTDATKMDTTWCFGVVNAKGDKKNFRYSAAGGLEQGVCP